MKETNLFNCATGELSQDAAICWLLSFAKNPGTNSQLENCAWDFIHKIPELTNANQTTNIEHQVSVKIPNERNKGVIDVLLTVDNYKVIIEDKIYSAADDSKIDKYIAALKALGEKNIIGVFYKPVAQWRFSEKYFTFTREVLFSIFNPYKGKINSDIFTDYLEYLEYFESEENVFELLTT